MARQIILNYNDKEYILEYTRGSIRTMEANGFNVNEVGNKPAMMIPILIQGAFIKHHRFLKENEIEEIINSIPKKTELIGELSNMVLAAYTDLLEDNKEVDEKKASWKIVK